MDPRPYHYEYRKPRFSNPTLYILIYAVNQVICTRASTISVRMAKYSPTWIKFRTTPQLQAPGAIHTHKSKEKHKN